MADDPEEIAGLACALTAAGVGLEATEIETQIAARKAARQAKDFAEAGRIRDGLAAAGILLEYPPIGTTRRRAGGR